MNTLKQCQRVLCGIMPAIVVLVIGSGCCMPLANPVSPPADEIREDLSLEEAQSLVPFEIRLPTYIPTGIEMVPSITYHADFGDPMESDVRLRYYDSDSQELMIEVYQRHRPGAGTPEELTREVRGFYMRELLAWEMRWSDADGAGEQTAISVTRYQDGDVDRWLYEIMELPSRQANMIDWGSDPVAYLVFTQLSVEEAKNIVRSIP